MAAKRALLVDNEEIILKLLARVLTSEGWRVVTAENGEAALRTFEAGRFSLVMTDVDLGGGPDGIALAEALRKSEPGLRIIIMSGDFWNIPRVTVAGFGDLLVKPFEVSKVTALLRQLP